MYGLKRSSLKDNYQSDSEFDRGGNRLEGKIYDDLILGLSQLGLYIIFPLDFSNYLSTITHSISTLYKISFLTDTYTIQMMDMV